MPDAKLNNKSDISALIQENLRKKISLKILVFNFLIHNYLIKRY